LARGEDGKVAAGIYHGAHVLLIHVDHIFQANMVGSCRIDNTGFFKIAFGFAIGHIYYNMPPQKGIIG